MAAVRMLKFIFCFVETTHEPLHSRQMNFDIARDHGHTYVLFESLFCF
jgi:hypothetical protein